MPDTSTSSIKSPTIWQVDLQRSKWFAAIYVATVLLALLALWHCPVDTFTRLLVIGIVTVGAAVNFFISRNYQSSSLSLHEDNQWQIRGTKSALKSPVKGPLTSGCYRSLNLVVIAIKPPKGAAVHAVIWRDSVPPAAFSFLQIQLAMTTAQQLS